MPIMPVHVTDIQGLTPAFDARNSQEVVVLDGKNFYFDSKGPTSGFGSRLVANGDQLETEHGIVQEIVVGDRSFIATSEGIYELSSNGESWIQHLDLSTFTKKPRRALERWTNAYLSNGIYICHPTYGFYKYTNDGFVQKTQEDIKGFAFRPLAIAETNGRLVVIDDLYISWSAPSQAEKFIPELGGAGQILLSDFVAGNSMMLAGFQAGFIAWTENDCLLAEFIGGDNVFRFIRATTEQIPLNPFAVEFLPDGSQLICTPQGIHVITNGREPKSITPTFNQFLRELLKDRSGLFVRLSYNMTTDLLFVQLRDFTSHYLKTYVLSVSIDKWGSFDERHLGILRFDTKRDAIGYMSQDRRIHQFVRHARNRELSPGVYSGLDSFIEIGYIRPKELWKEADSIMEMQELIVSGVSRPSDSIPELISEGLVGTAVDESEDEQGTTGLSSVESTDDENGPYSLLNHITYNISVASDMDGLYDEIVTVPEMAAEKAGSILWTLMTSGQFHRIRFEAADPGQYYHIRFLTATMAYFGQQS